MTDTLKSSVLRLGPQCANPCCAFRNAFPACVTPLALSQKSIKVTQVVGGSPSIPSGNYGYVCTSSTLLSLEIQPYCSMTWINADCTGGITLYLEGDGLVMLAFVPGGYDPAVCIFGGVNVFSSGSSFGTPAGPEPTEDFLCNGVETDFNSLSFGGGAHYKLQFVDESGGNASECETFTVPDVGSCELLFSDCLNKPLSGWMSNFVACDYSSSEAGLGNFIGHKQYDRLNDLNVLMLPGQSPYTSCTDLSFDYDQLFYCLLGRADTSDYDDPGILIESHEYETATNFHSETYCWGIAFAIKCDIDTGKAGTVRVMIDKQEFRGIEGAGWPPTTTGTAASTCEVFSDIKSIFKPNAGPCIVYSQMLTEFYYNRCDDGASQTFIASAVF